MAYVSCAIFWHPYPTGTPPKRSTRWVRKIEVARGFCPNARLWLILRVIHRRRHEDKTHHAGGLQAFLTEVKVNPIVTYCYDALSHMAASPPWDEVLKTPHNRQYLSSRGVPSLAYYLVRPQFVQTYIPSESTTNEVSSPLPQHWHSA